MTYQRAAFGILHGPSLGDGGQLVILRPLDRRRFADILVSVIDISGRQRCALNSSCTGMARSRSSILATSLRCLDAPARTFSQAYRGLEIGEDVRRRSWFEGQRKKSVPFFFYL